MEGEWFVLLQHYCGRTYRNGSITRRKMIEVGKGSVVRVFPIDRNCQCFGEMLFTPSLSECVFIRAIKWACIINTRKACFFPLLNCRVLQGLPLGLDLNVFTQKHRYLTGLSDFVFLWSRSVFIPFYSLSVSFFCTSLILSFYFWVFSWCPTFSNSLIHFDTIFLFIVDSAVNISNHIELHKWPPEA